MRAALKAEEAGVPSVSIVTSAFRGLSEVAARGLGISTSAIAEYPGVITTDSPEEFRRKVEGPLMDAIVRGFGERVEVLARPKEPDPRDIVFSGTLAEVQEHFHDQLWSDGLPIIPPTIESVQEFLRWTDRAPSEVIGNLLPENREASVWNIAVNGVMAGCRPEYMPVLIAVVETIADPDFRIEDAGSTPGWEPLIILSGPVAGQLDFNAETGALRVGRQANSSVGRFLRLYMRNIAGLRIPPGGGDKATLGYTFNVVLAENEDAVRKMGWHPFAADRGFAAGDNVVTVQSVVSASAPFTTFGDRAENHIDILRDVVGLACEYWSYTGVIYARWHPLLVMSPAVAEVFARDGWTKDRLREYLHRHVRIPASKMERYAKHHRLSLKRRVERGWSPAMYAESDDPDRLVPMLPSKDCLSIVVAGDPGRNQSRCFVNNHNQGPPVSRRIQLPARWNAMPKKGPG